MPIIYLTRDSRGVYALDWDLREVLKFGAEIISRIEIPIGFHHKLLIIRKEMKRWGITTIGLSNDPSWKVSCEPYLFREEIDFITNTLKSASLIT